MILSIQQKPLHGWLIIDKPEGITSTKVGTLIKKALGVKKIGHVGTLDPFASGVLPIAIGDATKLIPYFDSNIKEYFFRVQFGKATNTCDLDGEVIETCDHTPSTNDILAKLSNFTGIIEQIPPIFSAIKIKGKKAYKYARCNQEVDLPKRHVTVFDLKFLSQHNNHSFDFSLTCSAGTYVRSLARDLAKNLNTVGHVEKLQRLRVGKFTINNAILLEKVIKLPYIANTSVVTSILPIGAVLDDIKTVTVSMEEVINVRYGRFIPTDLPDTEVVSLWEKGNLISMAAIKDGLIRPKRVFNF